MALNLNVVNLNDTVEQLVTKLNENFNIISTGNGGAEGRKGDSGYAGLPGHRGIRGEKGDKGDRGTKWFSANNTSSFPTDASIGDYVVIKNNLDFYEKVSSTEWTKRGTFNLTKDFTIDLENISYIITDEVAPTPLDILINAKTNHTLLLTNIDRPDLDLAPQIPVYDSPGDSYPLIQKGSDDSLMDYKVKIYNSGDTKSSSTQIYGRNLHLANTYAMLRKQGWGLSSGFTMSIDLDINNLTTDGAGIEIMRINGVSSGDTNHKHRVEINNSDLWVSSFRIFKDGFVTLGYSNSYVAKQKLDINGAIRVSDTNVNEPGSIRFRNNIFQGYNESRGWFNLGVSHTDILNSINTDLTSFNGFLIDTSLDGAIVVGDGTAYIPKRGMIRFNATTGYFEGYDGTKWTTLTNVINTTTSGGGSGSGGSGGGSGSGGSGGGSGFVDENGDPINFKLAIGIDTIDEDTETFEGFALTSEDNTVLFKTSIEESKYLKIDLSAKNSLGLTDKDGNPISATTFDITSEDISVERIIDEDKLTFNLAIRDIDKFQDIVANSIDLRSSDGSVVIEPPTDSRSYWNLKLSGLLSQTGVLGVGGVVGTLVSAMRYTETNKDLELSYSSTYSGHYIALPFQTKDFDENCNVVSTNPLEISVKSSQSGYYNVSARVRFKITDSSGGTFSDVKLAVVKENNIISVLEKIGLNDIVYQTLSSTKVFELAGSDLIDFGCASGDCEDKFKFILVAKYTGLTSGNVDVTIEESNVAVHKISTLTKNNVEEVLNGSKQFFRTLDLYDGVSLVSNVSAFDNDASLKISTADYLDITLNGGVLNIEANIQNILAEIDPTSNILTESYSSFVVTDGGSFTHNASSNTNFEFEAGDNISLSLTGNKLNISSSQVQLNFDYDGDIYSNINKVDIDEDDFDVSTSGQTLNLSLKDKFKTSNKSLHIKTDYTTDWSDYSYEDTSLDEVIFGYLDYNKLPAILKCGLIDGEYNFDENIGDIYDETILQDSFIFSPSEDGNYTLTCSVGYNPVALMDGFVGLNPQAIVSMLTESKVSLGIFKLDDSGNTSLKNHLDSVGAELISIIDGDVVKFIPETTFSLDKYPNYLTHRVTGSITLPLNQGDKYAFGLFRGVDGADNTSVSYIKSGGRSFESAFAQLKIFVYDSDISITKL